MIIGLIARGIAWGVEAIQLAVTGVSAGRKLVRAAREGLLPTPSSDETDPFPLTYKDAERINTFAKNAGHEASAKKK